MEGDGSSEVGNNTVPMEGDGRQLHQRLWQSISGVAVTIDSDNNNNGNQSMVDDGIKSGQLVWEGKVMLYIASTLRCPALLLVQRKNKRGVSHAWWENFRTG
jgi:hypothetical protein